MLLENDKVLLRALEPGDLDFLFDIENDTKLWHLSNTTSPFSRFDLEQYILLADKDIFKTKQLRFVIEGKNKEAVGLVDLFEFEPMHKRAGIGIMIRNNEQNKGYASAALEVLFSYSSKKLGLHQLYCNIESSNTVSLRLFEKNGFVKTGIKKEWNKFEDNWVDELFLQKFL